MSHPNRCVVRLSRSSRETSAVHSPAYGGMLMSASVPFSETRAKAFRIFECKRETLRESHKRRNIGRRIDIGVSPLPLSHR